MVSGTFLFCLTSKKKKRQDKKTSSKRANIHNRWWRERSERNLRIFTAKPSRRPRRGRTQASCSNTQYVRPLRGRFHHHHGDRRLRSLRLLNQRLWIFALFEDASAAQPTVMDIRRRRRRLLEIDEHYKHAKILLCICESSTKKEKKERKRKKERKEK